MATSSAPLSVPNVTMAAKRGNAPVTPPAGDLQYIFSDDFSSGDFSKTENGFGWRKYFASLVVSTDNPKTGTHSVKIPYKASPEVGQDDYIELKTDFTYVYNRLVFEFDLYIPDGTEPWGGASWHHRSDGTADNNKMFRLYNPDSDLSPKGPKAREYCGASFDNFEPADGNSRGFPIFSRDGSSRRQGNFDFVVAGDRGKWMHLKFDCQMPSRVFEPATSAGNNPDSDGYMTVEKNGALVLTCPMNNYMEAEGLHGWYDGYLFGWANAGFLEETIVFMDNYEIWGVPA